MAENRTITIDGNDSGFSQLMEKLKGQGKEMYDSFQKQAENHSGKLQEQFKKVEELLGKQKEKIQLLREEQRLQAQIDLEQRLSTAKSSDEVQLAKRQHQQAVQEIDSEYRKSSFVVSQAGGMNQAPEQQGGMGAATARSVAGRGMGVGAAVLGGMGGGILAGGLMGIIGSLFGEGEQFEQANLGMRAMTGRGARTPGLGLKTAEAAQLEKMISQERGIGADNLGQLYTEKAFGLGFGSMGMMNQFARQGGGDVMGITQQLIMKANNSKLWEIDKGDFSALNEKMGQVAGLMEEEKTVRETGITGQRAVGLLEAFGRYGGGFADDRAGERIAGISGGIKNPANDFVKAMMMRSVVQDNPDANLLEVRQLMAGGASSPGVLGSVLKGFQQNFGNKDRRKAALVTAFPFLLSNPEALDKVVEMTENSQDFSEEALTKAGMGKVFDIKGRAAGATGIVEDTKARLADVIGETGVKSIEALGGVVTNMVENFEKIPGAIDSLIKMIEDFREKYEGKTTNEIVEDKILEEVPFIKNTVEKVNASANKRMFGRGGFSQPGFGGYYDTGKFWGEDEFVDMFGGKGGDPTKFWGGGDYKDLVKKANMAEMDVINKLGQSRENKTVTKEEVLRIIGSINSMEDYKRALNRNTEALLKQNNMNNGVKHSGKTGK